MQRVAQLIPYHGVAILWKSGGDVDMRADGGGGANRYGGRRSRILLGLAFRDTRIGVAQNGLDLVDRVNGLQVLRSLVGSSLRPTGFDFQRIGILFGAISLGLCIAGLSLQ